LKQILLSSPKLLELYLECCGMKFIFNEREGIEVSNSFSYPSLSTLVLSSNPISSQNDSSFFQSLFSNKSLKVLDLSSLLPFPISLFQDLEMLPR